MTNTTFNSLRPGEPRRLYQQVADQIRALILSSGGGPGSKLPSERDLAVLLGVSRPSLREALIALEIEGSIEIRMGSGVYVASRPDAIAQETRAFGESPLELMDARIAVEGTLILQASAKIGLAGIADLQTINTRMRQAIVAGHSPLDADRQFHVAIAAAVGNNVLMRIVGELFDERYGAIAAQIRDRSESMVTWEAAADEHDAIVQALGARDPLRAQAAMRDHLETSKRRWLGT